MAAHVRLGAAGLGQHDAEYLAARIATLAATGATMSAPTPVAARAPG